jgi:ankyrin repeat protein
MKDQGADGGRTPLHLASSYGQPQAVQRLIAHGAGVNAIAENKIAGTPLHAGTTGGQPECVKIVRDSDPDLTLRNAAMATTLELARTNNATEIGEMLESASPE